MLASKAPSICAPSFKTGMTIESHTSKSRLTHEERSQKTALFLEDANLPSDRHDNKTWKKTRQAV